jgi:cis-3,4-dihydrophenanthrene-3,4-diol dehydrogenase
MGWLEGQVALISGGASGIGLAVARRFVAEGARVVALDRHQARLETLTDELGARCLAIQGDAADPAVAEAAVARAINGFGRLDAVVANVGVFDWHKRLDRMSSAELLSAYDEIFRINVGSHLLLSREAYPHLKASNGSLTLTCSTASFRGGGGGALYTASKFAVRGLVYQLAHEWAPHVRVNGVAPGGTATALAGLESLGSAEREIGGDERILAAVGAATPLGFAAKPEDHAGIYVLLASRENARGMTGSVVVSDGGLLARI